MISWGRRVKTSLARGVLRLEERRLSATIQTVIGRRKSRENLGPGEDLVRKGTCAPHREESGQAATEERKREKLWGRVLQKAEGSLHHWKDKPPGILHEKRLS